MDPLPQSILPPLIREEARYADLLFNHGAFAVCGWTLERIRSRLPPGRADLADLLRHLIDVTVAYLEWDTFRYCAARKKFAHTLVPLRAQLEACGHPEARALSAHLQESYRTVEMLAIPRVESEHTLPEKAELFRLLALDLAANAARRALGESRYEDAVARLYSAIEKEFARRLLQLGIDNQNAPLEAIPVSLRDDFRKHQKDESPEGFLCFGLDATRQVLCLLDPVFAANTHLFWERLKNAMNIRNQSMLAHGIHPVHEKSFLELQTLALGILGVNPPDLVRFPEMNLAAWLPEMLAV